MLVANTTLHSRANSTGHGSVQLAVDMEENASLMVKMVRAPENDKHDELNLTVDSRSWHIFFIQMKNNSELYHSFVI